MKKVIIITFLVMVCCSQAAFAGFVGDSISLHGIYGSSSDGSSKELWRVLADAGYASLANDIKLDVNGGAPSSNYHVYKNPFWQFNYGYDATIVDEVAGYAPRNQFGWYEDSKPGNMGKLFSGPDSDGATADFSNPNRIGFWLNPNGVAGSYYFTDTALNGGSSTISSLSSSNGTLQAIAFYLGDYGYANEYLVCFEDLKYGSGSDKDFQDMIVKVRASTPEPATMSLLGLGLAGLLGFRKKRA